MLDVASVAERTAIERMLSHARLPSAARREGAGWVAVRTGAASNDLNGVVTEGAAGLGGGTAQELVAWFDDVPTSWLTTVSDPVLTRLLLGLGAEPERAGHWCGRSVTAPADVRPFGRVEPVVDDSTIEDWASVASACGWFDGPQDHRTRTRLIAELVDDQPAFRHWVVRNDGHPVGMAAAYAGSQALELTAVAVVGSHRRRGVGAALVQHALAWGRGQGTENAVAAPSPDGALLFSSLGFAFASVRPDMCFYLGAR